MLPGRAGRDGGIKMSSMLYKFHGSYSIGYLKQAQEKSLEINAKLTYGE